MIHWDQRVWGMYRKKKKKKCTKAATAVVPFQKVLLCTLFSLVLKVCISTVKVQTK